MTRIAVIDYGMGNLHSVCKALAHVAPQADIFLTTEASGISKADRILLPGQGAIAACMAQLQTLDLIDPLLLAAQEKPFLGICIGPQLMMQHSEENGGVDGLGLFDGQVVRFDTELTDQQQPIKIPHMGWNTISQTAKHPLWSGIADHSHFYYVHSYHLHDSEHTIGETTYGCTFPAAIARDNIAGLQAHPEKSSDAGLRFLANFVDWQP
ncbi:imidazole glycerol phosphate synthase subunit HisH [Suttonella sp. R2A3]|uniref:imidazole glycerol phosphate synthase subunit HisH n=1 Tax=Suttonella sp. R2A3 TaxID=2908648 RepID=UPI001F2B9DA3|nr:imidazole glycerol phosphate synthase subunit HisH [Suttonella sp. R2A3]UJF24811.1 imidazole glycerol phosphate synthase subunit HisH [Suttonella sp. R2A3]